MADHDRILAAAQGGDANASRELAALLHAELHALARAELAAERPSHTLQPTALVNEAWLRLAASPLRGPVERDAFFAAAATAIRRVLVDHARARSREKRGGARLRVPLREVEIEEPQRDEDLLALDDALARLAELDPRKARIVELRFFAGLSMEDLARSLGASESTLRREWRLARAWLRTRLEATREP